MVGVSMLGENAIHCQSRETKFGLAGLGYQLNKKSWVELVLDANVPEVQE